MQNLSIFALAIVLSIPAGAETVLFESGPAVLEGGATTVTLHKPADPEIQVCEPHYGQDAILCGPYLIVFGSSGTGDSHWQTTEELMAEQTRSATD